MYNAYYRDIRNNPFVVNGRPVYNKWLPTMKGGADKTLYELHQCNWERDFSEYNHIRNRENIILSHTYSIIKNGTVNYLTEPGDGYIYPSIVYGSTSNFYKNYNIYDLYPGFYTKTILKKIVEFTGRKFKDSELTKSLEFKIDFLPFVNEKLEMSDEQPKNA